MTTKNNVATTQKDMSIKLNDSEIVRYNNRIYSARWFNQSYGYYLVPINNGDINLGFWAPMAKCSHMKN